MVSHHRTGPTRLLFGGKRKTLGFWTRKVAKCYKLCLLGHPSRSLEDSSARSNMAMKTQIKRLEGTILVIRLEAIFVIFWLISDLLTQSAESLSRVYETLM